MIAKRDPAMDIIRCTALLCVVAVHFFKNSGFYEETVTGVPMYIMVLLRTGLMICVPLFLMLTGALMGTKQLGCGYYRKLGRTLGIYLLASLACILYRRWFLPETFSAKLALVGLFDFSAAPYGWYIEMYLGLFLLIPFLNILYGHLEDQRKKQCLLLTLLLLTAVPGTVNAHRIFDLQWWIHPASSDLYYKVFPAWWTGIYPLTYYFLGCYLREYPLQIKSSGNFALILLVVLAAGSYNFYRSRGSAYVEGTWQDYGALSTTLLTVLVFNFLAQGDYTWLSPQLCRCLQKLSDWSLGAYLVSWIFDQAFYGILNGHEPVMQNRLVYFPLVVPAVYVCSLALSAVLNGIYRAVSYFVRRR